MFPTNKLYHKCENHQLLHIERGDFMYYKIKSFCDERKISIHQMCVELGINDSIISNLKNRTNQSGLSAENACKIADFMGISVRELIKKEE